MTRNSLAVSGVRAGLASLATLAAMAGTAAATGGAPDRPEYPEGVPVTRNATATERAWMAAQGPLTEPDAAPTQPRRTVTCPGEYAPMEGILFAWEGGSTLNAVQVQMIRHITTTGDAIAYVVFDTTAEQTSALPTIAAGGANMDKVRPVVRTTDTIWIRDYGPRYVFEGNVRTIVDHRYNVTSRVSDDSFPVGFGQFKRHFLYNLGMTHGGGNYHLDSIGRGYASRLIVNENLGLGTTQAAREAAVIARWQTFQGVNTLLFEPFPTTVDATQHIDMWMQVIADDKVIIADWPNNVGSVQDVICDQAAVTMAARGYQVFRTPSRSVSGVHYTYTNMVLCNDLVLLPSYTNTTVAPLNAQALAVVQGALPGKTVVQINSQSLVTLAGVMHCIVMHVPRHRGGLNPTAVMQEPLPGASLSAGSTFDVRWLTDDDVQVTGVDLELSLDSGTTWTPIRSNVPDSSGLLWTVPNLNTTTARFRITARDAEGRTGSDTMTGDFAITGTGCLADLVSIGGTLPGDGLLTGDDFVFFISVFASGSPLADLVSIGGTPIPDGLVTGDDFTAYINSFASGCP
ncbi:MAG: agmatine deiminase family protein [Planctomycetaceae bacterium]|jgi:agmatine deiminase|nr:agmatine deiminase family protein [Planctomycetaceae bacterium]